MMGVFYISNEPTGNIVIRERFRPFVETQTSVLTSTRARHVRARTHAQLRAQRRYLGRV